jgi:methyl-accepting chemotaxis protein WspA
MFKNRFSSRLLLLMCLFFLGFAGFGLVVMRTLDRVKVTGVVYDSVILNKDLIADILPPPGYIIEAYLLARLQLDETDVDRSRLLQASGERLRNEFYESSQRWQKDLAPGELKNLISGQALDNATEFFRLRDQDFQPALARQDVAAARITLAAMHRTYELHRVAIDRAVTLARAQYEVAEKMAVEEVASSQKKLGLIGFALLCVVAFVALAAYQMTRKLAQRVSMASTIAERIAAGNLTTEIPVLTDSDEIAELLGAIGKMNNGLKALVTRAKQSTIELMSTATEYAATSRQQEATVQSFGASTNEIAAAVKQISATSVELLATMDKVNTVAIQTNDLAEQGQTGLKSLDSTMDKLAQAAGNMAARLAVIREEAAEITSVVTTIAKVADQTNLLSINAAIEAEKAGEQGLGFLVLAREIRRLADQTAVASLDIEQMVKQMQSAVSAGVMEIDHFAEEVKSGVSGVTQVGGQFGQIIGQVKVLSERFDVVNLGMRAQSQGARQIGESMGQLTDGARQTSISLREFNGATESLRDAVASLKQEIAQFNVGE